MQRLHFNYFPIVIILLYVPFHLIEEAYGNFPKWMAEHYGLPFPLSYPHWLINNMFFLAALLIGLSIYLSNTTKFRYFGAGIVLWGGMNSLEHIIFTVKDLQIAPGVFTGILFLFTAIVGLLHLKRHHFLNWIFVIKSIAIAILYWIIPFAFIISLGPFLAQTFK